MYQSLLTAHSFIATILLTLLILSIGGAFIKIVGRSTLTFRYFKIVRYALILSHLQLILGFIVYFLSPWYNYWRILGFSEILNSSVYRLYLIEHPITNVIAVLIITIGYTLHNRQHKRVKVLSRVLIFYGLGLFLLLIRLPFSSWLN